MPKLKTLKNLTSTVSTCKVTKEERRQDETQIGGDLRTHDISFSNSNLYWILQQKMTSVVKLGKSKQNNYLINLIYFLGNPSFF